MIKKSLLILFLVLWVGRVFAADSTVTGLTELASPTTDDLLYVVDDPGGTPLSRKATIGNVHAANDARTKTFTNTTLNAESTGNVVTLPMKIWLPMAQCNNATAVLLWDSPASNAAAAACYGTATKGVADFDATTDESLHIYFPLPSDWSSAAGIDGTVWWSAAATSGTARFGFQIDCAAVTETHDITSSNSSTFAATPDGTANRLVSVTQTAITTTGCAAGEMAKLKFFRDADGGSGTDDMSGDARVIGIELTIRRAM